MPKSKRNWATLFNSCPFKIKTVRTVKQIECTTIKKLVFNPMLFSSSQDTRVKYSFVFVSRKKKGVFVIKSKDSNRIITMGSSSFDLYEQIVLHIRRYKIDCSQAVLAIVSTKESLVSPLLDQLKQSYAKEPIDPVYKAILPLYNAGEKIPIEEIVNFYPLFDLSPRSIRHLSRVKTNIAHLQCRLGVYFIKEREKNSSEWELVYIGKAVNLNARIYAHFVKSQMDNQEHANYFLKLKTHEYHVGVIELPLSGLPASLLEKYLIKQINPRDNRKCKHKSVSLEEVGEWFDTEKPFWSFSLEKQET